MRPPAILADDLTGALDTAAQFTGRWGPVAVQIGTTGHPRPPPCAISSETRDRSNAEAVPLSLAAAGEIAGGVGFRKIDSLLRGPWAAELAALYRAGGFSHCVLAPAFPAQGRITRGGRQIAPGGVSLDIAAMLSQQGLAVGGPVRIADAETDADLVALVAREAPAGPLWCGAAGLARALAGAAPARPRLLPAPTLAVVGSDHPVTLAQIAYLATLHPQAVQRLRPGTGAAPGPGVAGLSVLCFDLPPATPRAAAASAIAGELARMLAAMPPPARLVATGGATLAAILDALGARRLRCLGEIAPGLPVSTILDGAWTGVEVLSKSGAFGGPETLAELCVAPAALKADERF